MKNSLESVMCIHFKGCQLSGLKALFLLWPDEWECPVHESWCFKSGHHLGITVVYTDFCFGDFFFFWPK